MQKYLFIVAALFAANSFAETIYESSFLELQEGFIGESLGIQVEAITLENEQTVIELAVPDLPGEPDNLKLLDSDNNPVPVKNKYQVIKDHEHNPKGLLLYLDKRHKRAFKIIYETNAAN